MQTSIFFLLTAHRSFFHGLETSPSARMEDEGASSGCESVSGGGDKLLLMMVAQAISDLRHNSGELVLMRSLRIHVLRLRSTLRSSSLIKGWRRSQADQRGAGMTFLSSLLSASQRIRTFGKQIVSNSWNTRWAKGIDSEWNGNRVENHLVEIASAADRVAPLEPRLAAPLDEFLGRFLAARLPHFPLARFRVALRLLVLGQRVGALDALANDLGAFRLASHARLFAVGSIGQLQFLDNFANEFLHFKI
jgi:hypothetical protein